MSASLVGSEMCIRDSRLVAEPLALHAYRPTADGYEPVMLDGFHYHRSGAVSYTHLTLPTICSV
eukprot:5362084-Alexandrium_andersonii.AAC.1